MNLVGILLAAGRGRRFDPGGAQNKLLQPLPGGEPVVAASARRLLAVLPKVVAVVPPQDGGVSEVLRTLGCGVTVCQNADAGMAASLVHGIRHSQHLASGWVLALGDMPFVRPSTIQAVCDALAAGAAIAAPVMDGRRGNPVGFASRYLPDLLALEGDQGARAILASCPVTAVAVDDPGIFRDIDTRADL